MGDFFVCIQCLFVVKTKKLEGEKWIELGFFFFIWTYLTSEFYRSHLGKVKVWRLGTSLFSNSGPSKTVLELACPTPYDLCFCSNYSTTSGRCCKHVTNPCYVCAAEVKMKNQRRLYFKRLLNFSRPVMTCPLQLTKSIVHTGITVPQDLEPCWLLLYPSNHGLIYTWNGDWIVLKKASTSLGFKKDWHINFSLSVHLKARFRAVFMPNLTNHTLWATLKTILNFEKHHKDPFVVSL